VDSQGQRAIYLITIELARSHNWNNDNWWWSGCL